MFTCDEVDVARRKFALWPCYEKIVCNDCTWPLLDIRDKLDVDLLVFELFSPPSSSSSIEQ